MAKKRVHRPEGYRSAPPPAKKPAPGRRGAASPGTRDVRDRFEDASRGVLVRMQALPGFLIPVIMGVLLFFGLTLSASWSGILLILVAAFLSWLTAVSWPAIGASSRLLRVVVDLAVLGLGVLKLVGRI